MTHSHGRPAVLPEVLQQQARLDDPQAAARRDFIRWAPCEALLHHWPLPADSTAVLPLSAVPALFKPAVLAFGRTFQFLLTGFCSLSSNSIWLVTLS